MLDSTLNQHCQTLSSILNQWRRTMSSTSVVSPTPPRLQVEKVLDSPGFEPRASRMLSGCDTTTPRARDMAANIGRVMDTTPWHKAAMENCNTPQQLIERGVT